MISFSDEALDWLAISTKIPIDALQISQLRGANSSAVYAIEHADKPKSRQFVLRIFTDEQWLRREPDLPFREANAMKEAKHCDVIAPRFINVAAHKVGFGAPVVLMSRLSGHVELRPDNLNDWCAQLAGTLAKIHAHPAKDFGWNMTSWVNEENLRVPAWAGNPNLWERAIEFWRAELPNEKPVFLHRDFHPCNVLWQNGKISGVVDWVNACRGPRGADVAHCRTNLAVLFGVEVADAFRDAYLEIAGGAHHSYWDVDSILGFSLPQPEFYRPWSEFGVEGFDWREMARRNEIYLASVMERAII